MTISGRTVATGRCWRVWPGDTVEIDRHQAMGEHHHLPEVRISWAGNIVVLTVPRLGDDVLWIIRPQRSSISVTFARTAILPKLSSQFYFRTTGGDNIIFAGRHKMCMPGVRHDALSRRGRGPHSSRTVPASSAQVWCLIANVSSKITRKDLPVRRKIFLFASSPFSGLDTWLPKDWLSCALAMKSKRHWKTQFGPASSDTLLKA